MKFETIQVDAHAKLNLALHITGRDSGGYHLLRMLNAAIDLHDTVIVQDAEKGSISVECSPFVKSRLSEDEISSLNDPALNTAARAAELFHAEFRTDRKTAITLGKRIPSQAGLGGGSSDAAAVLNALAQQFISTKPEKLSERLLGLAASVGADVPYFLFGGCAQVSGRGEIIAPIVPNPFAGLPLLLIVPPFGCRTSEVYAAYRKRNPEIANSSAPDFLTLLGEKKSASENLFKPFHNDLETAAAGLHPEIAALLKIARSVPKIAAGMTGSGSTLFACATSDAEAPDFAALKTAVAPFKCAFIDTRVI